MTRSMFEYFGDEDEYIRNLYYYTGAIIYKNNLCHSWADMIQPMWKHWNGTANTWSESGLISR